MLGIGVAIVFYDGKIKTAVKKRRFFTRIRRTLGTSQRFDIAASSPAEVKERLGALPDQRISASGVVVIKALEYRTVEQNRAETLSRLHEMVAEASHVQRNRRPTKPTFGSKQRRLKSKSVRAGVKAGRGKVSQ